MSIRLGTTADVPAVITNVVDKVVPILNAAGNFQWDHSYPKAQDFQIDVDNLDLWVYESEGGEVVGMGAFTTDQSPDYAAVGWDLSIPAIVVHRLAVSPDHQGKNIAFKLMQRAEDLAKEKNMDRVRVDTNSMNATMQRLLTKCGYTYSGEIKLTGKPEYMNFWCYEKIFA